MTCDRVISMTYARYFSFSDDSVNVDLPMVPSSWMAQQSSVSFHATTSPALELFKFRQIQSVAFQVVVGSARSALHEPWHSRIKLLRQSNDWLSALSDSTPEPLKRLLFSEMYYLHILLLQPPKGSNELDGHGTSLLFEYSISYIRNLAFLCDSCWPIGFPSVLDLRRTLLVASVVTHGIMVDDDIIFHTTDVHSPVHSTHEALPPLQRSTAAEKIDQAINAIAQLDLVLGTLQPRFGAASSTASFQYDSAAARHKLHTIRQRQIPPQIPW
jgi:hypothetical protein